MKEGFRKISGDSDGGIETWMYFDKTGRACEMVEGEVFESKEATLLGHKFFPRRAVQKEARNDLG